MMKRIEEEIEAAAKTIEAALVGLEQVSFTLDVFIHRSSHGQSKLYVNVILWFGHHFQKKVSGGDDIEWLAKECRTVAVEELAKISEIAKANESPANQR
jgi:hypothetical protein